MRRTLNWGRVGHEVMLKGFSWRELKTCASKVIPKIVDVPDDSSAFGTWDDSLGDCVIQGGKVEAP